MKRVLLLGPLLLVALTACAEEPINGPTVATSQPTETITGAADVAVPPEPQPTADGPCPYLDEAYVEETNGQRVSKVQTSADEPPACFFYRPDGNVQLSVRVYTGEAPVAQALVDAAAPVESSNPAELTGGWQGGAESSESGAVYAVAKEATAVVVTTNQGQTIKAKQVAQETISALGL
ncbi:DUF2020 domain-containing protein [Actinophytocola glycyrrhizae]|uniref:DUF2020 domain-containing protein n=1 Tax=Actinophytocola glycyrrhizae TaxID=2044873 RepID=A0ABV9S1T8_9PSEU